MEKSISEHGLAVRGDVLSFSGAPGAGTDPGAAVRFEPGGWLIIDGDRVRSVEPAAYQPPADFRRVDYSGRLVMPGMIDTHVHFPQIDVIASHGTELLDWLNRYTFPAEMRFDDPGHADLHASFFLDALLSHGTTSAMLFATVHPGSVDAIATQARERNMRIVSGKVMMDRNAPPALCDDLVSCERDSVDLIDRWHGKGRFTYAITPRFAPTSTPAQLALAGRLMQAYPGLAMQTHVAENRDEVKWVSRLFPDARSYLDVYANTGLLGPTSVFAHGIWLDDADRRALADAGATIAFCPTSNLFIGSGLFDLGRAASHGVRVAVATDVGGGTSFSQLKTLAEGYKVLALQQQRLTAWEGFYLVTRAPAEALGLAGEIGSFDAGTMADFVVLDWAVGVVPRRRHEVAQDWHERLFALMMLGDERNVAAAWVAGIERYDRSQSH